MSNISAALKNSKTLAMTLIALLLVVGVVAISLLPSVVSGTNERRARAVLNELAGMQAKALGDQIQQWQAALLARLQGDGVAALLQNPADTAQLTSQAENIRGRVDGAVRVHLLGTGMDTQGLRFSQIDRLRKLEAGEVALPEAFQEDGRWLFDMLLPIKSEDGVMRGCVIVVFDAKLLQILLAQVPESSAMTVLQQKFEQIKEVIVLQPEGATADTFKGEPVALSLIPHWRVVMHAGESQLGQVLLSPVLLFAAQAIVAAVCLSLLLLLYRATKQHAEKASEAHDTPIQIKCARRIDKSMAQSVDQGASQTADDLADPLFQETDVLDMDDEFDFMTVRPAADQGATQISVSPSMTPAVLPSAVAGSRFDAPAGIFRDYDVRGHAERDLSDALAQRIGRAFGSECIDQGHRAVVLAGDGRLSTPRLKAAVCEGLLAAGCDVVDVGNVPTPLMYFAASTRADARCGIMVTASHNPASDNGFKMVIAGRSMASEQIQRLRDRVQSGDFHEGQGRCSSVDIVADYVDHIAADIVLAGSYRVVVDCGNGIAGTVAPRLLEELGCEVIPLYCDVDGHFPNHAPDPSVLENLNSLVECVRAERADIGVALDGDGDRIAIVTASGTIVLPDRLLMLFAKDIASRNPGADIVFDVKSTRHLNALISSYGGRPVMWKSGHSHIKNKMLECGALLGGELSGHIFFKERWFGFDDGMYSAARLLEVMSIRDQDLDSIFAAFPESACTPEIRIAVPEDSKFAIVRRLADKGEWGNGKVNTLDGVRVDFAKGWGLVRASNTSAALTLRFEADDEDTLATVKQVFRQQLQLTDKDLVLTF